MQPTGSEECRVYYACDTTLRGWVPGPVYNLLGKTALKQTTTWVNEEALVLIWVDGWKGGWMDGWRDRSIAR